MDEPARKRRKTTSPDRQISPLKQPPRRPPIVSRSHVTASEGQSSPLKEPPRRFPVSPTKGTSDTLSSPLKDPPRKPPRRPSFASPTKASLARGYPDLLRPPSSGLSNGRADILARGKEARAFVLGEKGGASQTATGVPAENGDETAAGVQSTRAMKSQDSIAPRTQKTRPRPQQPLERAEPEEEAELPPTPSQRVTDEQYTARPGLFSSPSKRPPRLKDPVKQLRNKNKARAIQQDGPDKHLDGTIQRPDPAIEEKIREKARLTREMEALEKQVSRCIEEIAKIQTQSATDEIAHAETESLAAFINDICKPDDESAEDKPPAISSLLCSFLPFSMRQVAPPRAEPEHPIASHRPLELEDPLPYLEIFTSFEFSTRLSIPRGQRPLVSKRVHQKHVIDITGPQNLLRSTITATMDTLTNAVTDLKVLKLSHWADRELGSFIRARTAENDLGNACWAIGSYWAIAKKRAEYLHRCSVVFAHLLSGRTSEDTEDFDVRNPGKPEQRVLRRDLNRHLGRDTLVLEDRHVVLQISWKIGFDWTGEAGSEINAASAVPRVWTEADESGGFKKIPETFASLLRSKGAFAATKIMVALLFSE